MTKAEWAARGAIVLGALALALPVARGGAVQHLVRADPAAALVWAPGDPRVAMAAADRIVADHGDVRGPRMRALVATALARDATIPAAIEYRALQAAGDRDHAREARLFTLSDAISRRSLATRLWFIQRAVDRGDVAGALEDFDTALRTSTAAPNVLFPVLANAAGDPGLVRPIAAILDRPEEWRMSFLTFAIDRDAGAIAPVVRAMRDRRVVADNALDRALVVALVGQGDLRGAGAIDAAFHHTRPALLRDTRFTDRTLPPPFGWSLTDDDHVSAQRTGTALAFRAQPMNAGQAAAQLLLLAPGQYRLATTAASALGDGEAIPYWSVACGDGAGRQLATLDVPAAAGGAGAVDFTVPSGCGGQWLTLQIRASDAPDGQSGAIGSVRITRL